MNQTLLKRTASLMTAFVLFLLLTVGAMPARAAGMSVSASILPSSVSAGERFAVQIAVTGSKTKGTSADVSVSGLGGLTGGSLESGVSFDASGNAAFTVAAGSIAYTGSGATSVLVEVNGETATAEISGFIPTEDDTPITPVKPTGNVFVVKDGTALPTINAGETKNISLPLVNTSSRRYSDVQFTLELPTGLYVNGASFSKKLDFSGRGTQDLTIPLSADSSTASGVYGVTVNVTYKYSTETISETFAFNVKVTGSTGQTGEGRLSVVGYSVNPGTVNAGSSCKLILTVKNTGSSVVKDAAVTLGGLSTEGFTMNNSLDTQYISSLNAGATTNLTYNLSTNTDMSTGNYILDVTMAVGAALQEAAPEPLKASPRS